MGVGTRDTLETAPRQHGKAEPVEAETDLERAMGAEAGDQARLQFNGTWFRSGCAHGCFPAHQDLLGESVLGQPLGCCDHLAQEVAARCRLGSVTEDGCFRREAIEEEPGVRHLVPGAAPERPRGGREERVQPPSLAVGALGRSITVAWWAGAAPRRWSRFTALRWTTVAARLVGSRSLTHRLPPSPARLRRTA
jgi:hypothetical protein